MSAYYSDEDLGQDYTETNVLLGYASRDGDPDTVSRLGGRPIWLGADSPPSGALAKCKACSSAMVLLLQLNGELPDRFPGHERRLYVFSCRRPECSRKDGSVGVLRGIRVSKAAAEAARMEVVERRQNEKGKEDEEKRSTRRVGLGDSLFGGSGLGPVKNQPLGWRNPFGGASGTPIANPSGQQPVASASTDPSHEASSSLPQTFAAVLSLNTPSASGAAVSGKLNQHNDGGDGINSHRKAHVPQEPWPSEPALPRAYPVLYLADAEYEALDPEFLTQPPSNARAVVESVTEDGAGGAGPGNGRDEFESFMDLSFQKFADRMAQNPEQVIRYEFGGRPLLYSRNDTTGNRLSSDTASARMPKCGNCGSARVFEVQLTPHAIAELEADEIGFDGMAWGTIIVGVCERDCRLEENEEGVVSYIEEWVGVQWEEEVSR